MSKKTLTNVLKWGFSVGILVLLFRSGKLSLSDIQSFLAKPSYFVACVGCFALVLATVFLRWKLILASVGINLKYLDVLRLGMLGQFFSAVIPGSVGGDLVKAVYIARRYPGDKARALSTIVLDRFVGLFALVILGGVAFALGYHDLSLLPRNQVVVVISFGWILLAAAMAIVLGLIAFTIVGKKLPKNSPAFLARLPLHKTTTALYGLLITYQSRAATLWGCIGLSFIVHASNMSILYLAAWSIFGAPPWGSIQTPQFILAAVLGLCSLAIPIAPLGLGVGQVAFAAIFHQVGAPSVNFGTAIVTSMQIVNLLLNLSGALFFATYRHEVAKGVAPQPML
jgi:uncharacterized protein (TIRG00374 family)